jgi:small subunit ribosomal protein S17
MSIFSKKNTEKTENTKNTKKPEMAKVSAGNPKTLTGIVVSTKMKDTIVVKVDRFEKVSKYERFMKISKKYKAHDTGNTKKEGETVTIIECRPMSRDKHFRVA